MRYGLWDEIRYKHPHPSKDNFKKFESELIHHCKEILLLEWLTNLEFTSDMFNEDPVRCIGLRGIRDIELNMCKHIQKKYDTFLEIHKTWVWHDLETYSFEWKSPSNWKEKINCEYSNHRMQIYL